MNSYTRFLGKHWRKQPAAHTAPTLLTVTDSQCRWPTGEPSRDMPMCGKPTGNGPYCAVHRLLAYRRVRPAEAMA